MIFWVVSAVLALVVSAIMVAPLLRPREVTGENPDVAIYRAQLEEIDRDLERGLLEADEAERARAEVARRLIAASKEDRPHDSAARPSRALPLVLGAVVVAISLGLYFV